MQGPMVNTCRMGCGTVLQVHMCAAASALVCKAIAQLSKGVALQVRQSQRCAMPQCCSGFAHTCVLHVSDGRLCANLHGYCASLPEAMACSALVVPLCPCAYLCTPR
jgi:hypothetical protein